ncbi:DNA-3-methyladenine glycosylase [Isoptericola sp. CG 20/1183]|uniref:Putative 3-methyladenine DNA glycosylase n=1 Tax=Isoptericola halotolerans TaxID=300560 RepID=A0ABX5EF69_9MICO|nr:MULTISPECIES: DNA-3-methyladenine glycosylase [Isoptericola]PRZ05517.1 DNA-3-methyladenine glycosylase [Isoptericola halotolerans]PRZ06085.1 DNA-3-methyladenine glycosylase [Isoptericola sp. CG 20/1183]
MTGTTAGPAQVPTAPWQVPGPSWYDRDVHTVARDLLGAYVTRRTAEGDVTLRLTEVEAYAGAVDPASHAYRGRTERNRSMFGAPGRLYVYRHLGLHHCVNVVCGPAGTASAVLLRAGEVVAGTDLARSRRTAAGRCDSDRQIARGPARLTVALALDREDDGVGVTDADGAVVVHLPVDPLPRTIATGPRVGVGGEGADPSRFGWRSWLVDEPSVSAYRPVARRVR